MNVCLKSTNTSPRCYGIDNDGKLQSVIIHTPELEQQDTTDEPDVSQCDSQLFIQDHNRLSSLLREYGITVLQLSDLVDSNQDIIGILPDLTLLGQNAVICRNGAFLSRLHNTERKFEEFVIKDALQHLSIPVVQEFYNNYNYFQGFIPFDSKTIFVSTTINHEHDSVIQFIQYVLIYFEEVVLIKLPDDSRFDTADAVVNKLRSDCLMIYHDAIQETTLFRRYYSRKINFYEYCRNRGIDCITISETEQLHHACSYLSIDNERILHFDSVFEDKTRWALQQKRINILSFHSDILQKKCSAFSSYFLQLYRK